MKRWAFFLLPLWLAGCSSATSPPPTKLSKWQLFYASPNTFNDNHINAISLDNTRRIWLATNDGVSYFSRGAWATLRDSLYTVIWTQAGSRITYRVNCVVQAKDRAMWFGLPGGGVVRYNPVSSISVWRRYTDQDMVSDIILSVAADLSNQSVYGEVWFTSALGISRFIQSVNETGTWRNYTQTDVSQLPCNEVPTIATKIDDNPTTIWFGTRTGGAVSVQYGLAGLNWTTYPLPIDARINSIAFDLRKTAWFGAENRAWSLNLNTSVWTPYDSSGPGAPLGSVQAVVTNRQTTRWFGTETGLARWKDTTWVRFTSANSPLPSDTITALAYDYNQNLWIGTTNGLAVYNESGIQY